ncbi:hypothetical protein ACFL6R_01190 [Gemmatimonadota bacterium]
MKVELMRRSIAVVGLGVCLVSGPVSAQTTVALELSVSEAAPLEAFFNFGNVPVGDYVLEYLTITNPFDEDVTIVPISFVPEGSPFGTLLPFEFPVLPANASVQIPFSFSSYTAGQYTAIITLEYTGVSGAPWSPHGYIAVNLLGNAESGFDPVVAVNDLIVFTGNAILGGTLTGVTYGKWNRRGWRWGGWFRRLQERMAANQVKHFLRWLTKAERLIQAGEYTAAYHVLSGLLRRVDGDYSPRDWVAGQAAPEVAAQIESLMAGLAG